MMPWVAGVALGLAIFCALTPPPDARAARLMGPVRRTRVPQGSPRVLAAAAAVMCLIAFPLPWNLGAAGLILIVTPRLSARMRSRASMKEQTEMTKGLPVTIDLLAAALSSGATVHSAVRAVASCTSGPMSAQLSRVDAALALGADTREAWRVWQDPAPLAEVAAAITRAMRTGAPLADVLSRMADDLRREHVLRVEVAARRAGVRAVAPLVACFLPAFVLVGVVPVVASLAMSITQ